MVPQPRIPPPHRPNIAHQDDLGVISSALLGGSRHLPASTEERQRYIDGVEIRAKFVGTIETPEPRGMPTTIQVRRLRRCWSDCGLTGGDRPSHG